MPNRIDAMQLDIFEHSRDVILRNTALDALRSRDASASAAAIATLAREYGTDPLLPALNVLCERLRLPVAPSLSLSSAAEIVRLTEDSLSAAQRAFGSGAGAWMSPLWIELADAVADLPFDSGNEGLHAAALLLRAGEWAQARARIDSIASWRRQPAPLAWKLEAECRACGLGSAWPLLAELAWMAPQQAAALAPRLENPELTALSRRFDAQFEGEGNAEDFAWFPAWTLIAEPGWAGATRLAQSGDDTAAERCARQVLNLLLLERQGRHSEIVEGRRTLRALHPFLFDFYMQRR